MEYILIFSEILENNNNPNKAPQMSKYMRNQFDFYGIDSPLRKKLLKDFIQKNGLPSQENYQNIIEEMWTKPQREWQYCAMEILEKCVSKYPNEENFKLVERLITQKSWWDTVDVLAPHIVAKLFIQFPEKINEVIKNWIESKNIWLQRSTLIFQLSYKKNTHQELLADCIQKLKGSKEFFIQKAIGWALRQYARTHPEWVKEFVNENKLPKLSQREALKHIN